MEYVRLNNEQEHHCRVDFKDNGVEVDDEKRILHVKRWDVYMNKKVLLIKGVYSVKVSGYDGKEAIWEVVDVHIFE